MKYSAEQGVQLEGETMDAQVGGGRINFILRARNRHGSLNLNCSDKTSQGRGISLYS
jgi:hypothetical protein